MRNIDKLIQELEREKRRHQKYIKMGEKLRKRERDTFFTEKDRNILIESFVIGGILENVITKVVNRVL